MNTRRIIRILIITSVIVLPFLPRPGVAAEEPGSLPFLKIGGTYNLTSTASLPPVVKILESASGQWFRVEYYGNRRLGQLGPRTADDAAQTPREMWVNFAIVAGVKEFKVPDTKEPEKK